MRITKKLPSISNVGAGLTGTLNCPIGLTYDRITLELTNVTNAQITNIEVLVNGKVIQTYASGTELQQINDYYGRDNNAGYLTLYFNRPELNNLVQQRMTGLGTRDVQTLSLNFDLDGDVVSPAVKATAILSEPQPLGLINKVKAFPMSSAVAGAIEISDIPRGPRISAVHFFKADISNLEVEIDGQKVFDSTKALAEVIQKEHGRVPVTASATHFDTMLEGDNGQALVTAGSADLRFRPTLDTSGAVRVVVEYLDGLAGI
jgi:hypothetical protein